MDPGEQITGTRDEHYNLISVLYHALHGAENCEIYVADAEAADRGELATFFQEAQAIHAALAEQAKGPLGIGGTTPEDITQGGPAGGAAVGSGVPTSGGGSGGHRAGLGRRSAGGTTGRRHAGRAAGCPFAGGRPSHDRRLAGGGATPGRRHRRGDGRRRSRCPGSG